MAQPNPLSKRPKSAKFRTRLIVNEEHASGKSPTFGRTDVCNNCGGLREGTWKGGGYNMGTSKNATASPKKGRRVTDLEGAYITGLLQQIKILELENIFLKNHENVDERKSSGTETVPAVQRPKQRGQPIPRPLDASSGNLDSTKEETVNLITEIASKEEALERALTDNSRLSCRIKALESKVSHTGANEDRLRKQLGTVASLSTKLEQAENELKCHDQRYRDTIDQLEKQIIVTKDRDQRIENLQEEINAKQDAVKSITQQHETTRCELANAEKQLAELREKFVQSSCHILEETVGGLSAENQKLRHELKEQQLKLESELEIRERHDARLCKLVDENSQLLTALAEVRQRLESEIKVRENREARTALDSQDLSALKDKEKQLIREVSRFQVDLEKERCKVKSLSEKITQDNQQTTSLELRIATQKSRIAELEGCLALAKDSANNFRQQSLLDKDKIEGLIKELESSRRECETYARQLSAMKDRLMDSERKTEALATLQSHRWMEFSKMADNMKELSSNMLSQSKINTKKAVIRADLDEELEM